MTAPRHVPIPGGTAGTAATLHHMRQLVRQALTDTPVRETALRIVGACPERDRACQLTALRLWLRAHYRHQADPFRQELVVTPAKQLAMIRGAGKMRGDCDDLALLAATLGMAAGFPARFVVLGFQGDRGPYAHVYTELLGPEGWLDMDATRPVQVYPPSRVGYYPL